MRLYTLHNLLAGIPMNANLYVRIDDKMYKVKDIETSTSSQDGPITSVHIVTDNTKSYKIVK